MQVVGLGAFVHDQHDATLAAQHLVPVEDVAQHGRIAGGLVEVGVVERAAQAAGDAVGAVARVRARASSSAAIWARTADLAARMPVTSRARRVIEAAGMARGSAAAMRWWIT